MAVDEPVALNTSVLGTKAHWDEAYTRELANHQDDSADEGTIWFEDTGAEEKMIDYLGTSDLLEKHPNSKTRILDIGTGNGHLLFALQERGIEAELVGIDYSEASIQLARQIQKSRQMYESDEHDQIHQDIRFEICDLFDEEYRAWLDDGFDVVLDKGTFDAISLNANAVTDDGLSGWRIYGDCVAKLVRPGGFFLITSCNWTEGELRRWIENQDLVYHDRIKYPSFSFGGVQGQSVSTLCFRRPLEQP